MQDWQDKTAIIAMIKRSSIIAASILALSGCVSSAAPDVMTAIEPLPTAQTTESADVQTDQSAAPQMAQTATDVQDGSGDTPVTAENAQMPSGDTSQFASLTMQSTAVNANSGSIFAVRNADGSPPVETATTTAGEDQSTVPAYVPVPGVNPALRSLYQGSGQTQEASLPAGQTTDVDETSGLAGAATMTDPASLETEVAAGTQQKPVPQMLAEEALPQAAETAQAENSGQSQPASIGKADRKPAKKRTLADFFGAKKKPTDEESFNANRFSGPIGDKTVIAENAKPLTTASITGGAPARTGSDIALPGVNANSMFATADDSLSSDGFEEDIETPVEIAALPGLARLASNGFWMQTEKVDTGCFKPELMQVLGKIEAHYGRKLMVTSGFREAKGNRARQSLHTSCSAADIQIAGVGKWELAAFLRTMPGRGGVGTYCHTNSVHIDVGSPRDWNWRCRRRK